MKKNILLALMATCILAIGCMTDEEKQEAANKKNKAEIAELLSKGKTEKAKAHFIKSNTNQEFFADNLANAVELCDDDYIIGQLSTWKLEYYGKAVTFNKEVKDSPAPDGYHGKDGYRNNFYYNEVATEYNNTIESVVYHAILTNRLDLAERCIKLYVPLAKEKTRKGKEYHYDMTFEEDNHYREEAEESIASLRKVKAYETKFNNTQFARGSAELSDAAKQTLDELAKYMELENNIKIKVIGHTSTDGKKKKNMELSKERAESVVNYLTGKGISPTRLQAEGVGSTQLKNSDSPKSEENCRTEFFLL